MKNLFGTDGMRGEAGVFPLDAQTMRIVGSSLAVHLRENAGRSPLILIGRDTRESGPWLEQALLEGARSTGAECLSAGVITTPGVAYLARTLPADAGIVISASHNPFVDNGIKIFSPSGQKLGGQTERLIEADIYAKREDANGNQPPDNKDVDQEPSSDSLQTRYLDFLADAIGKGLSLTGLKVVLDCANGAASTLAPQLLARLGAVAVPINNNPDGRNINLDCGSLHVDVLAQAVIAERADLGVAFDGDADRSLFVDSDGNYVDGDATLWVLANYLKARGKLARSLVVATVMSNLGLELALTSRDIKLVRTDVGDKYVLDKLLSSGASLGGEQSGHVILPSVSLAGDGMITSLYLIRAMKEEGKSLRELTEGLEHYPQILLNVRVKEKVPFSEVPPVRQLVEEIENKLGAKGRTLLRYSGTEPLARIMLEGQSQSEIEAYADKIADVIRRELA